VRTAVSLRGDTPITQKSYFGEVVGVDDGSIDPVYYSALKTRSTPDPNWAEVDSR
jgi:hypothetical protein